MPWLWAAVSADPRNVDAWTTAWYAARSIMKDASWKLEQSTGVPVRKVDVYIDTIIR